MLREEQNADQWYQHMTKEKLMPIVKKELITNMAWNIVSKENGIDHYFAESEFDKLKLAYEVFSWDESALERLVNKMGPFIEARGTVIVLNENNLKDPLTFT